MGRGGGLDEARIERDPAQDGQFALVRQSVQRRVLELSGARAGVPAFARDFAGSVASSTFFTASAQRRTYDSGTPWNWRGKRTRRSVMRSVTGRLTVETFSAHGRVAS